MRLPPAAALLLALTGSLLSPVAPSASGRPADPKPEREAVVGAEFPNLDVEVVADDLDVPWDVQPLGDGRLLTTQRDRAKLTLIEENGDTSNVDFPSSSVWVSGETGLMGLEIDPDFADNRKIYTCQGKALGDGDRDIRVIRWQLNNALTAATLDKVLLKGLPVSRSQPGRHGGCRLLIHSNGDLIIGTGDAATGRNPQDKDSLGGKTLAIDPDTGNPAIGNPWRNADTRRRFVMTYGHRNVQGLALRSDKTLWSVEHGSFRDDEVNLLVPGRNFGWHPVPGYNESVPMTDFSLPGKQWAARWRSGEPTEATSGASFVKGAEWGRFRGALAIGCLAGEKLLFVKFDDEGKLRWEKARVDLDGTHYGRLRAVTRDLDGSLLVTTSNGGGGSGGDMILRITPAGA